MIRLEDFPTDAPEDFKKKATKKKTKDIARRIGELQRIMYAQRKHSLLVVLQGMDAAGKDGATRKVFRYCSATGLSAKAFKKPTPIELEHDFLWRVHPHVPRRGRIQVFNRSHYEDILIQRVHRWIDETEVDNRIRAINAFEQNLQNDNDTTVLKFYLHISKERQEEKLQERIDDPTKHWKHNPGDWQERKLWDEYMRCYEDTLNRSEVDWVIAPVDKRWYRDYFIASKVLETMESLDLQLPKVDIKMPA